MTKESSNFSLVPEDVSQFYDQKVIETEEWYQLELRLIEGINDPTEKQKAEKERDRLKGVLKLQMNIISPTNKEELREAVKIERDRLMALWRRNLEIIGRNIAESAQHWDKVRARAEEMKREEHKEEQANKTGPHHF